MTTTDEQRAFEQWAEDWRAGAERDIARQEQIRQYVARRGNFIYSIIVVDFVIGGIALPVLLYLGLMTDNDVQRFSMLGLASITLGTVGFGWWNWRSVLRASAASVSDYVAVSKERLRRMRLAWRVAWIVLTGEVVFFTIWIWDRLYGRGAPATPAEERFAWLWLTGFSAAFAVWLFAFGRWLARDEARFEALRRELVERID